MGLIFIFSSIVFIRTITLHEMMTMSEDTRDDALEEHRRIIASRSKNGLTNTVDQRFKLAADSGNDIKRVKGTCPVCGEPYIPGYAVRCSDEACQGEVFHQSCFGTHTIRKHQPQSVVVVMRREDNDDYKWQYVDMPSENTTETTLSDLERVPTVGEKMTEDEDTVESVTEVVGLGEEAVQPRSGEPRISTPEDSINAGDATAGEKVRPKRTKKRESDSS